MAALTMPLPLGTSRPSAPATSQYFPPMVSPTNPAAIKQVRFSNTCIMIVVPDLTVGIEDKLWYSSQDVEDFKAEANVIIRDLRDRLSRCYSTGTPFALSTFDDISGLENRLTGEYLHRRRLLMSRVMEEHLWQRLRSRVGASTDDCDAETERLLLASISEENSRWARKRAREAGLLLQKELYDGISSLRRASQVCTDPEQAKQRRTVSE